jgi:hypothetical protein
VHLLNQEDAGQGDKVGVMVVNIGYVVGKTVN